MTDPPDHVKKKILMVFMKTSIPRIIKEETLLERKMEVVENERC